MLNLNSSVLSQVAEQACKDAAQHGRWLVAIGRALVELESNPWIERGDHGLIIGSTSGKCYAANGICQCKAFEYGQPCWHRAAARLVRLHDEREAAATQLAETVSAIVAPPSRPTVAKMIAAARARVEMDELFA